MATIGQQLTVPETGWRRYDDNDSKINYIGTWAVSGTNSAFYGNTNKYSSTKGDKIKFVTYTSRLRIIGAVNSNRLNENHMEVFADGVSIATINTYGTTLQGQILQLDYIFSDGLKNHHIEIVNIASDGRYATLDAIDIDDIGYLMPYTPLNIKTSLADMQKGDAIPCKYVASSGVVGTFSELGTCVANEIPLTSSATPNGLFYFVHAGYDYKGRIKLIADRNIQHTVLWDTLNTKGIASGLPITISNISNNIKLIIRLLTGGISATDKDNEWDKIISGSTLNSKIIAGDNAVWHTSGIASWASTAISDTSANRVIRGNATVSTYSSLASGTSNTTTGFRPMLLVEFPLPTRYRFVKDANGIYALQTGFYKIADITPTDATEILPYSADNFSLLVNELTQNNVPLTDKGILGSGKFYEGFEMDLKNTMNISLAENMSIVLSDMIEGYKPIDELNDEFELLFYII
jgi:hypothetical protein